SVVLAFLFGYSMTLWPLLAGGMPFGMAAGLALASDTLSITVMEIVDNVVVLLIPGAMDAGAEQPAVLGKPCIVSGRGVCCCPTGKPLADQQGARARAGPRASSLTANRGVIKMKAHYLGHVVFYVKDLERSLGFYRDLL